MEVITNLIKQNPFHPVCRLPEELKLDVHPKTLLKTIRKRTNLKFYRSSRKPFLENRHTVLRYNYALNHQNRTEQEWQRTVFIDEKVFSSSKDGL